MGYAVKRVSGEMAAVLLAAGVHTLDSSRASHGGGATSPGETSSFQPGAAGGIFDFASA